MIWEKSLRRDKSPVPLTGNNRTLELSQGQTRLSTDSTVDLADINAIADPELVEVLGREVRLWTDDEISGWIEQWHWIIASWDLEFDECPPDIAFHSEVLAASYIVACEKELRWRSRHGVRRPARYPGFPREFIDELKLRRPLVDEVMLCTNLRQVGSSCRGKCPLCPGHRDSEALLADPKANRFRCFRCNIGGDIITWLSMLHPDWDFRDIITYLSGVTGVDLPKTSSPSSGKRGSLRVR